MIKFIALAIFLISMQFSQAFDIEVPDRTDGEGQYDRLILRGGYVIDGRGHD